MIKDWMACRKSWSLQILSHCQNQIWLWDCPPTIRSGLRCSLQMSYLKVRSNFIDYYELFFNENKWEIKSCVLNMTLFCFLMSLRKQMKLFAAFHSSQFRCHRQGTWQHHVSCCCMNLTVCVCVWGGGSCAPPYGSFSTSLPSIDFYTVLELCCQPEGSRKTMPE
jgi:hypothetical protein